MPLESEKKWRAQNETCALLHSIVLFPTWYRDSVRVVDLASMIGPFYVI